MFHSKLKQTITGRKQQWIFLYLLIGLSLASCLQAIFGPASPEASNQEAVSVIELATPTATTSPSPTMTLPPTYTPLPTDTPTETSTSTPVDTATNTPIPPTPTRTSTPTPLLNIDLSKAAVFANVKLPTPAHTPTATPLPRTVRADNAPDYTQSEPHFWFNRPYNHPNRTWGSWQYPYGTNNNGLYLWHRGIDIQNPQNTPVLAVGDGLVVFAANDLGQVVGLYNNFYGQAVILQHEGLTLSNGENFPVYTLYGHVSQTLVQEGDIVSAGQMIALTGQGGVALGPHLHLEIRLNNALDYLGTQNPDLWIRPDYGYGVIAGRVVDKDGFYVPQQLLTLHQAASPNRFWRQTRTYPDHRYTPDPQLGETFTFADVPAGNYVIKTSFDGINFDYPVTVQNQAVSFILIDGRTPP